MLSHLVVRLDSVNGNDRGRRAKTAALQHATRVTKVETTSTTNASRRNKAAGSGKSRPKKPTGPAVRMIADSNGVSEAGGKILTHGGTPGATSQGASELAGRREGSTVDARQGSNRKANRCEWLTPSVTELRPAGHAPLDDHRGSDATADRDAARVANVFVHDFRGGSGAIDLSRLRGFFGERDLVWREVQYSSDRRRALAGAHVRDSAIMDRLDDVCGPENWKNTFGKGPNGGAVCGLSIRVGNEWITKWDTHEILPYMSTANRDREERPGRSRGKQIRSVRAMGSGLRRAALQWGIGRYLDRIPKHWMPVAENGRLARRPMLPPDFRLATARDDFESMRLSAGGIGSRKVATARPIPVAVAV